MHMWKLSIVLLMAASGALAEQITMPPLVFPSSGGSFNSGFRCGGFIQGGSTMGVGPDVNSFLVLSVSANNHFITQIGIFQASCGIESFQWNVCQTATPDSPPCVPDLTQQVKKGKFTTKTKANAMGVRG